jgi:DNA primase
VLEYFLENISSLTPHSNLSKKKFYVKKVKSLDTTKKYFNESKSLTGVELKEFSLLYLVMKNIKLFKENIHLIENVKFFTDENKQVFNLILSKLKTENEIKLEEMNIDDQLVYKIDKFASIKHILKNNPNDDDKVFELIDEISRDLKNYDLEFRIEELESKFSKDLSESTFNELKELKKQKNLN